MGVARRCLRPVVLPVAPHPYEGLRHGAARRSCSRPRGLPQVTCHVETRLAACLELHDLRRAHRHIACRAPDTYRCRCISSPLSVCEGASRRPPLRERRGRSRRSAAASRCRSPRRRAFPDRWVGDREAVRDHADHHQPRVDARRRPVVAQSLSRVDVTRPGLRVGQDHERVDLLLSCEGVQHRQRARSPVPETGGVAVSPTGSRRAYAASQSQKGRTSTLPKLATGCRPAISIAWSSVSHSMTS